MPFWDHIVLHTLLSARTVYSPGPLLRGKKNHNIFLPSSSAQPPPPPPPHTPFPLPTAFLGPASSAHRPTVLNQGILAPKQHTNAQSNHLGVAGLCDEGTPKRNRAAPFTLPSPGCQGTPHSQEAPHELDCPQEITPKRITFSICNLVLLSFNMCCVLSLCGNSTSFHFAFYLSCCWYGGNVLAFQFVITHHHIPNL